MEFTVPKFIEKEARIVGPLTFKQFIFVGIAAAICVFLFFILPTLWFVLITILLAGGALSLAFIKVKRVSLPQFISNFFVFVFKPRIYLWKRKTSPPKFLQKKKEPIKKKEDVKEKSRLKVSRGSRLDELFTRVETKQ